MLRTDMVKGPYDRSLKQRPSVFNAVGMDVPANPFLLFMIYSIMIVGIIQRLISPIFVREHVSSFTNALSYYTSKNLSARKRLIWSASR